GPLGSSRLYLQNTAVMEELYRRNLSEDLVRDNGLSCGGREYWREPASTVGAASDGLSEEERRTAADAAERMTAVIAGTPGIAVERNVRDFRRGGWDVTPDNVESEFREVERRTFSDGVHWGRVIAFLAFSMSFAAYVNSRGIDGGAYSVFNWTLRVLNDSLADFIQRENGWRGFIVYADTLLRAQGS
uniref:Bcl-x homologous protein, BHP2 n=1 Tax=Geodia cydonium TaxID=6047 RepID=UPI0009715A1B|nr:Chain A, Bcl-x homologous protein, BHP2 [Geodia cydonium]5TWA_B Chain B, Bcl-x homologous protein, BHP2 [Geodia cydonium]